jgi:hypothetical protein
MKPSDATITHADIRHLRQLAMKKGWGNVALDILDREPVLAAAVSMRWFMIRAAMLELGLTEEQSNPVLYQMSRMMVESIGAMQHSGRRLWDDMLPGADDGNSGDTK